MAGELVDSPKAAKPHSPVDATQSRVSVTPQDEVYSDLAATKHVGPSAITRGLFISSDQQREIHFVKVSGVSMIGFSSPRLKPEEIADVLAMVKDNNLKKVMIADTIPTAQVVDLVSALRQAGVTVHFRDHHADDYYGERNKAAIRIAGLLGNGCTVFERSRAPTIMSMIDNNELVHRRFDLFIAAPVDPDATCGFLKGVGLNPQRITESNEMNAEYALGTYDSPNDQRRCRVQGAKDFPIWLETMSQIRAIVDQSPSKLCDAISAFAQCIDRGDIQLAHTGIVRLYAEAEARINFVKALLVSRRAGIAPILEVDATVKRETTPQSVTEMPLRVEDLKQAFRSLPKASPDVVFKLITTDQNGKKVAVYETNGRLKDLELRSLIGESGDGHVFHSGRRLTVPASEADLVDRKLMSIARARRYP